MTDITPDNLTLVVITFKNQTKAWMQNKSNIEKCLDEQLKCTLDQLIDAFIEHSKPDAQLTSDTILLDERSILKRVAECNRQLSREVITPRIRDISIIDM